MPTKNKPEKFIGQKFINNKGTEAVIIQYNNSKSVLVQFKDDYKFVLKTSYSNLCSGKFSNPFDKTVYGVGYLGAGSHKPKNNKIENPAYTKWKDMIRRCTKSGFETYANCTVSEDWLCFQNFAEWYEEQLPDLDSSTKSKFHLDKDILQYGAENKTYSASTCLLVHPSINTGLAAIECGYSFHKRDKMWRTHSSPQKYFKTEVEAKFYCNDYSKARVYFTALDYKDTLPEAAYSALLKWANIENLF